MTEILVCKGCGATKPGPTGTPTDFHPAAHCGDCPPWRCERCGQMCSAFDLCFCWQPVEGMNLADLKGLFAQAGLDLDPSGGGA